MGQHLKVAVLPLVASILGLAPLKLLGSVINYSVQSQGLVYLFNSVVCRVIQSLLHLLFFFYVRMVTALV